MGKCVRSCFEDGDEEQMILQTELLELLADEAEKNCDLDTNISLEELPAHGGLYAELGEGFTEEIYYDKSTMKTIPILFLCRHVNQKRGLEELCKICNYYQRLKRYPEARSFKLLDIEVAKEPNKIGRDEDGVYHFSCILNCKIFY